MARRVHVERPASADQERAYLEFKLRALDVRLMLLSAERDEASQPWRDTRLGLARRAEAVEAAAVAAFGEARTAAIVRSSIEGRSAWAPADDFSVSGPYAPPGEVVAERRRRFRRAP